MRDKHDGRRFTLVWSPKDFQETVSDAELDRHAGEAMALLRPSVEDGQAAPCPVINLFTRERVR